MKKLLKVKDLYIKIVITIIAICLIYITFLNYNINNSIGGGLPVYIENRYVEVIIDTPLLVEIESKNGRNKRIHREAEDWTRTWKLINGE